MAGPGFVKKHPGTRLSQLLMPRASSLENDTGTIQASKTLVSAASCPVPMACRVLVQTALSCIAESETAAQIIGWELWRRT